MTSVLNVDEIAAKNGTSPVTLTKQEATKQWISWDGVNNDIEGSLNVSSVLDEETGVYTLTVTSAYSSQHDRCIFTTLYNSNDDGGTIESGSARAMGTVVIGTNSNGTIDPLATTTIQYATAYGSTSSSDGGMFDLCKVWVTSLGDLA